MIKKSTPILAAMLVVSATAWTSAQTVAQEGSEQPVPHYDHVFVIVDENKGFDLMMTHPEWTPVIHKLAAEYGLASNFYAEVHSSEGNYIAMLGGDTFGIHDDDAFYCKPHLKNPFCAASDAPRYVDHSLTARSLPDQLAAKGLSWKAYLEDLPSAGSLVPRWPTADYPVQGLPQESYAAKHNGFVNFASVHDEPFAELQQHFVGFDRLYQDLAADVAPNYAHIVPNQCNDMHGMGGKGPFVPADCDGRGDLAGLVRRGDTQIGMLVDKIMHSKLWRDPENAAIVITFDENDGADRKSGQQGCCGYDPKSLANFGGGHIATLVITNHGPRHMVDPTPYNHYSLLRTTEAVFGIGEYLGHAADKAKGVVAMSPLFAVAH